MMMFTGNSSPNKSLPELAFGQQLKTEQAFFSATGISVPNPLSDLPNFQTSGFPYYSYANGHSHSTGPNLDSGISELHDQVTLYSQHLALNGGTLVLDSARGELVNASKMTLKEILEAKALAASKSHSEAERRRRERINSHLARLRSLLPGITKTDKASLLAEVIGHLKELKRRAAEIAKGGPIPTDVDELSVEADGALGEGRLSIKASLCCDDRPDLISDLIRTLRTLGLRTVKAEICTLGGRVKTVFLMTNGEENLEENQERLSINCVQEALRAVMERATASGELSPRNSVSNKRQRILPLDA